MPSPLPSEKTEYVTIPLKVPRAWYTAVQRLSGQCIESQAAIYRRALRAGLPLVAQSEEYLHRTILRLIGFDPEPTVAAPAPAAQTVAHGKAHKCRGGGKRHRKA